MKIKQQFIDLHKDTKKRGKICLLSASLCLFTFTGGYAQTGKVSLNLDNASVKELFNAIEKQTSYRFSYRDAEVNGKTGVSVSVKSEELKNVLTSELNKQNLSYKVSGNKIIITPLKKKSEKNSKVIYQVGLLMPMETLSSVQQSRKKVPAMVPSPTLMVTILLPYRVPMLYCSFLM